MGNSSSSNIWKNEYLFSGISVFTVDETPVVIEMGVVSHFSYVKNSIKLTNNKIPHYARDYKKEYLFIRGINKIEN